MARVLIADEIDAWNDKPRLLTAYEIGELPRTSIVWIEYYNAETGQPGSVQAAMKCWDGTLVDEEGTTFEDFEEDMTPNADGWFRFWSAEPTEEQRRSTPWASLEEE